MRDIFLFDIDGTLTLGDGLGTRCFFRAVETEFRRSGGEASLERLAGATDSGLSRGVLEGALGRRPTDGEVQRHTRAYLSLLRGELNRRPEAYGPVPGAREFLTRLRGQGFGLGLVSANWSEAAFCKLRSARILLPAGPHRFAEHGEDRSSILQLAVARHRRASPQGRVVYLGDRPCDVEAARAVGVAFLGIGEGKAAERLRGAGVRRIFPDYLSPERILEAASEG